MNASEVTQWLQSIDLGAYAERFYDEDFRRMSDVAALQDSALKDLGVARVGQRMRILGAAKEYEGKAALLRPLP